MNFLDIINKTAETGEMPNVQIQKPVKGSKETIGTIQVIKKDGIAVFFPDLKHDTWFWFKSGTDKRRRYTKDLSFCDNPDSSNSKSENLDVTKYSYVEFKKQCLQLIKGFAVENRTDQHFCSTTSISVVCWDRNDLAKLILRIQNTLNIQINKDESFIENLHLRNVSEFIDELYSKDL